MSKFKNMRFKSSSPALSEAIIAKLDTMGYQFKQMLGVKDDYYESIIIFAHKDGRVGKYHLGSLENITSQLKLTTLDELYSIPKKKIYVLDNDLAATIGETYCKVSSQEDGEFDIPFATVLKLKELMQTTKTLAVTPDFDAQVYADRIEIGCKTIYKDALFDLARDIEAKW